MASTGGATKSSNGGGQRKVGRGAGRSGRRGGQAGSKWTKVKVEGRPSERAPTRVATGMVLSTAAVVLDRNSSGDKQSGVDSGRGQVTKPSREVITREGRKHCNNCCPIPRNRGALCM